jgi:hypothetical protein
MINLTDLTDEFASPAAASAVSGAAIAAKLKAAFVRAYGAMVKSRQARADQLVRSYLGQHDDAQLTLMGVKADEIKNIRTATWRPTARY